MTLYTVLYFIPCQVSRAAARSGAAARAGAAPEVQAGPPRGPSRCLTLTPPPPGGHALCNFQGFFISYQFWTKVLFLFFFFFFCLPLIRPSTVGSGPRLNCPPARGPALTAEGSPHRRAHSPALGPGPRGATSGRNKGVNIYNFLYLSSDTRGSKQFFTVTQMYILIPAVAGSVL